MNDKRLLTAEVILGNAIVIDIDQCIGCELCVDVCSGSRTGRCSSLDSRIRIRRDEPSAAFIPVFCLQCIEHSCYDACLEEAIYYDSGLSIYRVDSKKCTGCGACEDACAYKGIFVDGVCARKCDLCDGRPVCVEVCIPKALRWTHVSEEERKACVTHQLDVLRDFKNAAEI